MRLAISMEKNNKVSCSCDLCPFCERQCCLSVCLCPMLRVPRVHSYMAYAAEGKHTAEGHPCLMKVVTLRDCFTPDSWHGHNMNAAAAAAVKTGVRNPTCWPRLTM